MVVNSRKTGRGSDSKLAPFGAAFAPDGHVKVMGLPGWQGAIQSDAAYAVDLRIEGGLAYGGGEAERRGVFGNS